MSAYKFYMATKESDSIQSKEEGNKETLRAANRDVVMTVGGSRVSPLPALKKS
jgi:hypothetical protein